MRVRIPAKTLAVLKPLADAARGQDLPIYAVGGCVRDWLLGRKQVKDLDLVTEGDPAPIARLCASMLGARAEAFGAFGTLRVNGKDLRVDFAAARLEEYPEPACLPKVRPASLSQDLFRRDFTINAMAMALEDSGELIDPYAGLADLRAKTLRVLHSESFRDDPTRVFRAARFLRRFGFKIAPGFRELAQRSLSQGIAGRLSRHRIAVELLRILAEKDPGACLRTLRAWGYLDLVSPDLGVKVSGKTVETRLGSLALAMGEKGEEFLRSLPIEHDMARRIHDAIKLARLKASPRGVVSPETKAMVSAALPRLSRAALKPLFITGADLSSAGLKPGPEFRAVLDEAARRQWTGGISSRSQALRWLARRLAVHI
jgi:tRNA nucleotidyltransferase (CCA-adding enzyme)